MANQRKQLGENLGETKRYHATFGGITHKGLKHNKPVLLLQDVYEVDEFGHKKRIRRSDSVVSNNKKVLTDHSWIELTKRIFKALDSELFLGDEIEFNAQVSTYNIVRDDVLDERNELFKQALKKNDELFIKWKSDMDEWVNSYELVQKKLDDLYVKYKNKELTFDEMQKMQKEVKRDYKKKKPVAIDKIKERQQKNLKKIEEKQQELQLVDYKLVNISKIDVVKYKRVYYGWDRLKLNSDRLDDLKYTKYLAARQFGYSKKQKFSEWNK